MASKSAPAAARRQYRPAQRVRYQTVDPVQRELAALLRAATPGAAHQRFLRALPVIRAFAEACRRAGASSRLTNLITELTSARDAIRPADGQLTFAEWTAHLDADRLEDAAREAFHLRPCLDTAVRLDRALVREIDVKTAVRADLQILITELRVREARD